jgi:hypothetical protein
MNEYELPSLGNLKSPEIRAESALEEFLIASSDTLQQLGSKIFTQAWTVQGLGKSSQF